MKRRLISLVLPLMLGTTSCVKPPPPEPVPTPEATPLPTPKLVPTPHPAKGATETAIRLYPDLGKKDSTFNRTFLELFEEQKKTNPASLTAVDWPLTLARRTAAMLRVAPYAATPTPRAKVDPRLVEIKRASKK